MIANNTDAVIELMRLAFCASNNGKHNVCEYLLRLAMSEDPGEALAKLPLNIADK